MTRDLYPTRHRRGQPGPAVVEVLDALHRLWFANAQGWHKEAAGTPGGRQYQAAMANAESVLQRSRKYGEVQS